MLKRRYQGKKIKTAQSLSEYLLVVAAVLVILVVFLRSGGFFTTSLNSAYQQTITMVNLVGTDIFNDITN